VERAKDLAVVGAAGAVGEAVLEQLSRRGFPKRSLLALDQEDGQGKRLRYGDGFVAVQGVEQADLADVRAVILCPGTASSHALVDRAVDSGCLVVDAAGLYADAADVPLVVSSFNPPSIGEIEARRIVACASAPTVQLLEVLGPVHRTAGVVRVDLVVCQSVSGTAGGVEELARQSAALLSGRPISPGVFPAQVAFNLIPQSGPTGPDGSTQSEQRIVHQVRRLLGDALELSVTVLIAPVFYGDAQIVSLQTRDAVSVEEAHRLWRGLDGVSIEDDHEEGLAPTPVTHAAGNDSLFIARLRSPGEGSRGLQFWTLADGVRHSSALNSVQIAEILVKAHL